jgi:hypothetical protein
MHNWFFNNLLAKSWTYAVIIGTGVQNSNCLDDASYNCIKLYI